MQRVCDESQDFLILVQEKHCAQITQSFIRKSMGRKKLDTFNLSKMRSLTKSEQIPSNKGHLADGEYRSLRTFCCLTFPLGSSRKLVRMAADSFCITAPAPLEAFICVCTLVCDCFCGSDGLDERLESAHRQGGQWQRGSRMRVRFRIGPQVFRERPHEIVRYTNPTLVDRANYSSGVNFRALD